MRRGTQVSSVTHMLIWVLAGLLVGGFGLVGHQSGAIRSGLGLIGAALGLALTGLLGGLLGPALAAMGVTDQIALKLLPGLFAFQRTGERNPLRQKPHR